MVLHFFIISNSHEKNIYLYLQNNVRKKDPIYAVS